MDRTSLPRLSVIRWLTLALASGLLAPAAWAGDVEVRSKGAPVVVVRDGAVLGTTPLTLRDLPEGTIQLGFREAPLAATAFTQLVPVPAKGLVVWEVDAPSRIARKVEAGAASPVAAPVATAAAGVGDLYVTSAPAGAAVWLDGVATGQSTPAMLRGVTVGRHVVQVRTECARGEAELNVTAGLITRGELSPTPGAGSLDLTGTPAGAVVLVDGVEVGALPAHLDGLGCGDHQLTARAPGYLEVSKTARVVAFERTALQLDLAREEYGTLVVDITPLDGLVSVDGLDLGAGPRTLDRIAAGPHKVTGSLDGYAPQSADIVVPASAIARVNLALVVAKAEPQKAPRTGRDQHAPWGRIALDVGVSGLAVGAGALALHRYQDAAAAYDTYLATSDATRSQRIYDDQVAPARKEAILWGGIAGASAIGAAVLWLRTDF